MPLWYVENLTLSQFLVVPITFLYANLMEYLAHRGPMHHRVKGAGIIFDRHTLMHHRFFTHEAMNYDGPQDIKAVLFPPVFIVLFFGVAALPVGMVLYHFVGQNVACLFVATAVGYYFNYEILHFVYHLDEDHWIARLPGVKGLRLQHLHHHNPRFMKNYNFNITYPICDLIFRTQLSLEKKVSVVFDKT